MSVVSIKAFNVLTVYCDDYERCLGFYRDVLGMRPIKPNGDGMLLEAGEGEGVVTVYLEGGRRPTRRDGEADVVVCGCFDLAGGLKAAYDKLRAAGVTMIGDWMDFGPSFAMFRIADPSGNCLEFAGKP